MISDSLASASGPKSGSGWQAPGGRRRVPGAGDEVAEVAGGCVSDVTHSLPAWPGARSAAKLLVRSADPAAKLSVRSAIRS
jgi:hypothetical protein